MTPMILSDLQILFKDWVLAREQFAAVDLIGGDSSGRQNRLGVYRDNVQARLLRVLRGRYPVVEQLVAADFFSFAIAEFARQTPPNCGCLSNYGEAFPEFLESFTQAAHLPYLPDVARLEWMIDRSQISDEIPPIALSLLQTVSGNAAEKLGLRLDPAVQFLASPYPVDKIWQAHQVSNLLELEDTLDVGSGSVFLQIRGNHEQTIVSLTPSIWIFRTSLSQGHSLVTSLANAEDLDPHLDAPAVLAALFHERLVVGLTYVSESV